MTYGIWHMVLLDLSSQKNHVEATLTLVVSMMLYIGNMFYHR